MKNTEYILKRLEISEVFPPVMSELLRETVPTMQSSQLDTLEIILREEEKMLG